jgi:molybdenum cofactor cytidylyltransferase
MMRPKCGALILAAGLSSRWQSEGRADQPSSKMLALWKGVPFVRHVALAAHEAQLSPVIVVLGHDADEVRHALRDLDMRYVYNEAYKSGMASSLKAGVHAAGDVDGLCVLLGDMPLIDAALIAELVQSFEHETCSAVVPVYQGQRGNPVILGRAVLERVDDLRGDQGARPLLAHVSDLREVRVDQSSVITDIDTPSARDELSA